MAKDSEVIAHQQWIGYVQPVGLVVSIPALVQSQAFINKNIAPDHQRFLECLPEDDKCPPAITDLPRFTQEVLGWEAADLVDFSRKENEQKLQALEVPLPEYHETLRPTHGVREFEPKDPARPWMMLIQKLPLGHDLDEAGAEDDRHWQASPHARFERLLRETQVPAGLLFNGTELRLVYAPRGENSGYATFRVKEMAEVSGRPIFAALHMLLCAERLFSLPERQRLPAILADSRKYQNVVSTQLAEQVMAALFELLRGFQAANAQAKGELLREVLAADPNEVYAGLLRVLMRLVFTLYAEDRGLMSSDPVYASFYSVTGLFERLRADAGRYTDTMDQRYGAWAQLLALFRMIYEGGRRGSLRIPARRGYLFDPDRYPFLEGRPRGSLYRSENKLEVPHVSDGVLFRVLSNLLILDGERLSYRTLDVEQIGSVYEAVMGFQLQVAGGRSIAIKPTKSHGAPATINLEALLAVKPGDRAKWLAEQTDQKLTGQAADGLKKAGTIEDLLAALEKKIAEKVTPNTVPKGAMVLQPSDERRRSGSHYTPRSLTAPIVRTTLRPVLERLGANPTPEQILELNVCDPAMGSGAFLVETCRQLGDELVKAWHVHNQVPKLPPDEDELLHARRVIAQRCLYGVDRNPMAVDLAKLSLWLATLAKDHPFTFLDHSLRSGDSLVGLTKKQIAAFHWRPTHKPPTPRRGRGAVDGGGGTFSFGDPIADAIKRATEFRLRILAARDEVPYEHLRQQLDSADEALDKARFVGDLIVAAYFSADKDKVREERLRELALRLVKYLGPGGRMEDRQPLADAVRQLRSGDQFVLPFHWETEFPEVFGVENPGFDAIVGNPPFLGGRNITERCGSKYSAILLEMQPGIVGGADLVAHFFCRAFSLMRTGATFGLIATNTIAQGDTRNSSLTRILGRGGIVYQARTRQKWPGQAAVMVCVVHVAKGVSVVPCELDGKPVSVITAFLFSSGGNEDPKRLQANQAKSFQGYIANAQGFVFDDNDRTGAASSTADMRALLARNGRNAEVIFPFIGGEEINDSPTHSHHRYAVFFGDMTLEEANRWDDVISFIEPKVKHERKGKSADVARYPWWKFWRTRPELRAAIQGLPFVFACSQTSKYLAIARLSANMVFTHKVIVFAGVSWGFFSVLQSRVHQGWADFFGSSLEDRPVYTPSDCFETFPFSAGVLDDVSHEHPIPVTSRMNPLRAAGQTYYQFRADLMVRNNEGLTKTYNRFHDPNDASADILTLRELHAAMDRAVLDAYGWTDLKPTCEFLLDYEEVEEDENGVASKRKKPWRYRWPDEFRDEVLARLLELSKLRAEEEQLSGQAAAAADMSGALKRNRSTEGISRSTNSAQRELSLEDE